MSKKSFPLRYLANKLLTGPEPKKAISCSVESIRKAKLFLIT